MSYLADSDGDRLERAEAAKYAARLIQGTAEWKQARCGKVTASRIHELAARAKSGWAASRASYMAELLVERLTGAPGEGYVSDPMAWGIFTQSEARIAYETYTGWAVHKVGFVAHPAITMAGCSPDGLIGDDGLIEIKCPSSKTHIETRLSKRVPDRHMEQIQFQLACTERHWGDFVSYDPRLPVPVRLFIKRVPRDDHQIQRLEDLVVKFLIELENKVFDLTKEDRNENKLRVPV